jgi:GLPGLI family protein
MKILIYSALLLLFSLPGYTQLDSGIIHTTITTRKADGTMLATSELATWYKHDQLKIISKTDYAQSFIYIDRTKRLITDLSEVMGKKIGFYVSTDNPVSKDDDSLQIVYEDTTRYINGFRCNKATIIYTKVNEKQNDIVVWYSTDYKFRDSTMGVSALGIERLPGFPIVLDIITPQGILVNYVVNSIDTSAPVPDNEFIIPKGYVITTQEAYREKLMTLVAGSKE